MPARITLLRRSWRILAILLTLLIAWSLYLGGSIAWYASRSDTQPADAAIVLGAAVAQGIPSPVFEQRIRHALDLYHNGRVRVLVMTGGIGAGDTLAESAAARDYCLARGVPPRDILIETASHTTYQNLVQARSVLVKRGLQRALIVSDPLHMRRSVTLARDLGIDAHPSPTPTSRYVGWSSRGKFLAREVYFHARYLLERSVGIEPA